MSHWNAIMEFSISDRCLQRRNILGKTLLSLFASLLDMILEDILQKLIGYSG